MTYTYEKNPHGHEWRIKRNGHVSGDIFCSNEADAVFIVHAMNNLTHDQQMDAYDAVHEMAKRNRENAA